MHVTRILSKSSSPAHFTNGCLNRYCTARSSVSMHRGIRWMCSPRLQLDKRFLNTHDAYHNIALLATYLTCPRKPSRPWGPCRPKDLEARRPPLLPLAPSLFLRWAEKRTAAPAKSRTRPPWYVCNVWTTKSKHWQPSRERCAKTVSTTLSHMSNNCPFHSEATIRAPASTLITTEAKRRTVRVMQTFQTAEPHTSQWNDPSSSTVPPPASIRLNAVVWIRRLHRNMALEEGARAPSLPPSMKLI